MMEREGFLRFWRRPETGSTLVEFAFVVPVVFMLIFGIIAESGRPFSIEKAVAQGSPLITVNPAPLCATSATATQLTQSPIVNGDVNITVTCGGTCAAPSTTAVTLAFDTKGLVAPFGLTYDLTATSQVPVLSP